MSETSKAVFLSYAREDAAAARHIAEALRASGVVVWFDESELRGGDSWDANIRQQIKACALFMPIISASTQARAEGYFRLEWRLADRRTELIGKSKTFLLPVCIDDTREAQADVPDSFCAVQWTRLPAGETSATFCARVRALLGGEAGLRPPSGVAEPERPRKAGVPGTRRAWIPAAWIALVVLGTFAVWKSGVLAPKPVTEATKPPHSLSEARKLAAKADTLFDQDDRSTRETVALAEKLCQQALALDPNDAEVWAVYSRLVSFSIYNTYDRSQERRRQAAEAANNAVRLAPTSFEARYALACFYTLDDTTYREAERILRKLLEEQPNNKRVWRTLGRTLLWATVFGSSNSRGREQEAIECLHRAAALPGGDPMALSLLGAILASLGQIPEADAALNQSIALKPDGPGYGNKMSFMLRYVGDLAKAREALAHVPIEQLRQDRDASIASDIWLCSREPDKAIEALRPVPRDYLEAAIDAPKSLLIAQAHRLAGRPEAANLEARGALQVVDRRLTNEPNNVRLLVWRAWLLAQLGDHAEARRLLQTTRQMGLSPRDAFAAANIAVALGDSTEAIALLNTALAEPFVVSRAFLRIHPAWDSLRSDPRFQTLVKEPKAVAAPEPAPKSIAVLAFRNLSNEKDDDVFSDGISDELANVLGRVPGLRVVGSASAFSFKGKGASDQEIGRKLGVNYIVDGSVWKANGRVRITAKLINATDGFQVWASEPLERELKDVWAVQDEIVGVIAQNLQLKLGGAARPAQSVNPEAHRLVLEGRHFWNLRTDDDLKRSREKFTLALEIDPQFAAAHAGLADANVIIALYSLSDGAKNVQANLAQGRAAARRAQELDPSLSEPFGALAYVAAIEGDLAHAERNISQAIALNPNHATAHQWRGVFLERMGRLDEALQEFERSVQLDPLSWVHQWTLGEGLLFGGRETQALAVLERAEILRGTLFIPLLVERAEVQLKAGRLAEAIAAARTIRASWPAAPRWWGDGYAVWILRQAGQGAEADDYASEILAKLPAESYQRGVVLAAADRFDEALPFLERTPHVARRILFWSALFDRYRTDARFERLMATLGCLDDYKRARETLARIQQQPPAKR